MNGKTTRSFAMWLMRGIFSLICWSGTLQAATVKARLVLLDKGKVASSFKNVPPSVLWLKPIHPDTISAPAPGKFSLLQKNKMFSPHLLVVPVGSNVSFPNADPFFHNAFSLFDGKRFDLGLYEAGSMRSVVFSREGVSYIFCNIHPEMSAVVLSLTTPFYSVADAAGNFQIAAVPSGEYELHVWIEGGKPTALNELTQRVRITNDLTDLGEIRSGTQKEQPHLNKFGRPYEPESKPVY